jgi:hypothetical protein
MRVRFVWGVRAIYVRFAVRIAQRLKAIRVEIDALTVRDASGSSIVVGGSSINDAFVSEPLLRESVQKLMKELIEKSPALEVCLVPLTPTAGAALVQCPGLRICMYRGGHADDALPVLKDICARCPQLTHICLGDVADGSLRELASSGWWVYSFFCVP